MPSILIGIPNSVKTVSKQCYSEGFLDTGYRPLHRTRELHQKDLRIIPYFMHILGPENEAISRADMFLALSLVVGFQVSDGSY